ncbi:hypothetical protein RF11_10893 [Thelohanellus kitauei]|uniref:Uncharacterized protein n=1 Tax=Thelohanellus kitauei TaxID=669202 RepID=A0A0C2IGT0_THEKT|nr:hypothetical protein RF11_10893 [Thelohanellus kitauei]
MLPIHLTRDDFLNCAAFIKSAKHLAREQCKVICVKNLYDKNGKQEHSKEDAMGRMQKKKTALDQQFSIVNGQIVNINSQYLSRSQNNGSLCYKHIALSGYKKAMDRIAVLCCTNM